jgi:protein-disulfide isomerase
MTASTRATYAWGSAVLGLVMGLVLVGLSLASVAAAPAPSVIVRSQQGTTLGDANAKVQIVVYFDPECSHCMNVYYSVEGELVTRYVDTGKAKLEFRPLTFLGPASVKAVQALLAAAEQGKYWQYQAAAWDAYRQSGPSAYSDASLRALAAGVGLNVTQFDASYASSATAAQIKAFADKASSQNVTSVPHIFINSQEIVGEAPLQEFTRIIDAELAK